MAQNIFKRVEKKYMLDTKQYEKILETINLHMTMDEYGLHTITNLYLDTDDFVLIRRSLEKPTYKEKIRLRSYGIPNEDSKVFLELKKKYNGVVYKRRIDVKLNEVEKYLEEDIALEKDNQILNEIKYSMRLYNNPKPKVYIAYDRQAYSGNEDENFRITFDKNVRYRMKDLKLEDGDEGETILPDDKYIMEVKTVGAMPLWLVNTMGREKIFPTSFSKYGSIYLMNYKEFMEKISNRN